MCYLRAKFTAAYLVKQVKPIALQLKLLIIKTVISRSVKVIYSHNQSTNQPDKQTNEQTIDHHLINRSINQSSFVKTQSRRIPVINPGGCLIYGIKNNVSKRTTAQPRSQGLSLPAPQSSRGRGERDPGNEVDYGSVDRNAFFKLKSHNKATFSPFSVLPSSKGGRFFITGCNFLVLLIFLN